MKQQISQQRQMERKDAPARLLRRPLSARTRARPLFDLHRTIGNHGVLRGNPGVVQTKLTVSSPGDKYEQEADRVAEQVMRMPDPEVLQRREEDTEEVVRTKPIVDRTSLLIQRKVEEEPQERTKKVSEPDLATNKTGKAPGVLAVVQAEMDALQGGGQSLPEPSRLFFESRFGHDFSQVRVHVGRSAHELAHALKAQAFTVGKDIVFGADQYAPETAEGKKLLSHELTHVVQWMARRTPQRGITARTYRAEVGADRATSNKITTKLPPSGDSIHLKRSGTQIQPEDMMEISYIKDVIKLLTDEVAYYSRYSKGSLPYSLINRILTEWRRVYRIASGKISKVWPEFWKDGPNSVESALRQQLDNAYQSAIERIVKLAQTNSPLAIGYVGLRTVAHRELEALRKSIKSRRKGGAAREKLVEALPPKKVRFEFRRDWPGTAVKTPEMQKFISQELGISPRDRAKFKAALECLRRCDASFQEQMADMMRMFRNAETGKYRIRRLVLSGHAEGGGFRNPTGAIGGRNLVLKEQSSLKIDQDLGNLVAAFPLASVHIEHIIVSRCYSTSLVKKLAELFPKTKSIWVYELRSPTVEQGSYLHIQQWERITRGGGQELPVGSIASRGKPLPRGARRFGSSVIWIRDKGFFIPYVTKNQG